MSHRLTFITIIIMLFIFIGCVGSTTNRQDKLLKMGYSQEEFEIIRQRKEYELVSDFGLYHKLKQGSQKVALTLMDITRPIGMVIPMPKDALSVLYAQGKYSIKNEKQLLIANQDYFFDSTQKELILNIHPSYFYFLEGNRLAIVVDVLIQLKKGKTTLIKRSFYLQYRPMIKAVVGKYSFKYIDLTPLTIDDIDPSIVTAIKDHRKFIDKNSFVIEYEGAIREMIKAVKSYQVKGEEID